MIWIIYLFSVVYCIFRMYKRYVKYHGTDVIGATPGLETLAIIALAPVLMIVDVSMTWIRLYREAEEVRRDNQKIF